jgi:hypothetical protein
MRILAASEHELDFWVRHVKVGVRLTYATAVVSWAYFVLTWGRPNRPAMTALVAATAMMSTVVARLPLRRILSDRRGIWLFYGWSTGVVGFVTGPDGPRRWPEQPGVGDLQPRAHLRRDGVPAAGHGVARRAGGRRYRRARGGP